MIKGDNVKQEKKRTVSDNGSYLGVFDKQQWRLSCVRESKKSESEVSLWSKG